MNNPSPLIPQGSLQNQSQGKSTLRIAVFSIIAIHAVFFTGILIQGCKPETPTNQAANQTLTNEQASTDLAENELPPLPENTNYFSSSQEIPGAYSPAGTTEQSRATAQVQTQTLAQETYEPTFVPPVTEPETETEYKEHTVVRGDSLYKIAKQYGVTVGALSRANPDVEPSRLIPGDKLRVPAPEAGSTALSGAGQAAAADGSIHTVRAGENLTVIAKQHGVTIQALKEANNLRTDRIYVGQKLKLPISEPAQSTGGPSSSIQSHRRSMSGRS